jgi:hypothetical protein
MKVPLGSALLVLLAGIPLLTAQDSADSPKVSLTVPSGAPLRLYLTKRIPKRLGTPVQAKVMEPVFSVDREVIPAGVLADGEVIRIIPVSKWQRARAILNGDFTPLRGAEIAFRSLQLHDGRTLPIQTTQAAPLNSIYVEPSTKPAKHRKQQPQDQNGGVLGTAKQAARDRLNGAINARTRGVFDTVRGPNKKEKLVDFAWSKLPYHPQYFRRGTRIDAPLHDALSFGSRTFAPGELSDLGAEPAADSIAHVRLLTPLDSSSAKVGESVEAVIATPLYSPGHKLVLPEGTRLTGTVVVARKARTFHRGGQLRFNFQKVELPAEVTELRRASAGPVTAQATLNAAEGSGAAQLRVDSEGGVQAKESKTRFLAPAISLVLASRSADNDAGHHGNAGAGGDANVSGRTLGGGLGLGMAGAAVSQTSRWVGLAFGYYGFAWSVYSSVVARGGEVQFEKNAMMDIKFGSRSTPSALKFASGAAEADQTLKQ